MLKVVTTHEAKPSPSLLDEWRGLLGDSDHATPFQTPAWVTTWWKHFGKTKKPHWIEVREGSDLVGLYPLYLSNGPWRALRAIGTGQSDYLHPLSRQGYANKVRDVIVEHAKQESQADLLDLHQLREDVISMPESAEQAVCLTLDLPDSYDSYLKTLSKSLRYDCRRMDRSEVNESKAELRIIEADEARWGVRVLLDLHGKRWRKRGLPGAFATRQLRDFHMDAADALAHDGHLKMGVLKVDDRPAGAIYAMQTGKTRFFYQCGFEPEQKALSPGTLLVAHSIRSAIDEGCTQFDFLRGDEPYKRRWKPQHENRNLRYILPLNTGLGAIGKAYNDAGSRVEAKIRAKLEGRGFLK